MRSLLRVLGLVLLVLSIGSCELVGYLSNPELRSARLQDLQVSPGTLDPPFGPLKTEYEVEVPAGTESVTVTATAESQTAVIEISWGISDGETVEVDSGEVVTAPVDYGSAHITVDITSEDGRNTMQYKVHITDGD